MVEIIHKELSYKIIGILFEVDNKLGNGLREKVYQNAISEYLKENNIPFNEQVKVDLKINDKVISRFYLDFLVDNKIILEIKAGNRFDKENIAQVYDYLKTTNLKLGILANFTKRGVIYKRIINKKTM